MMTKPLVVLMTATLDPGRYRSDVRRADPRLRAKDYIDALKFWAAIEDPRIMGVVFCENSGGDADLSLRSALEESILRRPIEWLGFDGNTRPPGMHYGYSELGILDHAFKHSQLLNDAGHFIKVTGRLKFPRISELLNTFDDETRFAADCRWAYKNEGGPPIRVRTELMMFERLFYSDHFYERRDEMLSCCSHIEEFIALKVLPFRNQSKVILRFRTECPSVGTGAHNGMDYQKGKYYFNSKCRQILRKIAPRIWI